MMDFGSDYLPSSACAGSIVIFNTMSGNWSVSSAGFCWACCYSFCSVAKRIVHIVKLTQTRKVIEGCDGLAGPAQRLKILVVANSVQQVLL
ncbi:MAG: hypothetical protein ACKPKO_12250, partial [Candidatus Fonsibacter sp.]